MTEHITLPILVIQGGDGHFRSSDGSEHLCHTEDELLRAHRGADALAFQAAKVLGLPTQVVWANWILFGRAAGPRRNSAMLAELPNIVMAFHDDLPRSKGTKDMLTKALAAHVPSRRYWHKGADVEYAEVAFF